MSSDEKSKNVPSEPQSTGAQPRIRTESECSDTTTGKRQRTTSAQYMVASGLTAASPPKFVSLEEIMQAANGMKDMALVHQIVVDDDFRLKKAEPQDKIQQVIKDTMQRAFWSILREQLAEVPPEYKQALVLLEDVKEGLFSVLLPQHTKLRQQISEVLDADLIKQQAEQGVINFKSYAQFVIGIMSKLCAPIRDEKIKELTETVDVVDTFRGILETLDLMILDMANFTLRVARPDIIACSVELERQKFSDFLAVQADGLENTRQWLLKYVDPEETLPENVEYEKFIKAVYKRAFSLACLDLMEFDGPRDFPETFMLDESRIAELKIITKRLIMVATVLLVTLSNSGPDLQTNNIFKQTIRDHIFIILQSLKTEKELTEALPNVAEQVITDLKEALNKYHSTELPLQTKNIIKQQIVDIGNANHKVRAIVNQRVKEFFLDIIESSTAAPQKVPSGLSALQKQLTEVAGQFLRIVSHNDIVFCIYYLEIVSSVIPRPA